jgi:hypothetical protein
MCDTQDILHLWRQVRAVDARGAYLQAGAFACKEYRYVGLLAYQRYKQRRSPFAILHVYSCLALLY